MLAVILIERIQSGYNSAHASKMWPDMIVIVFVRVANAITRLTFTQIC